MREEIKGDFSDPPAKKGMALSNSWGGTMHI